MNWAWLVAGAMAGAGAVATVAAWFLTRAHLTAMKDLSDILCSQYVSTTVHVADVLKASIAPAPPPPVVHTEPPVQSPPAYESLEEFLESELGQVVDQRVEGSRGGRGVGPQAPQYPHRPSIPVTPHDADLEVHLEAARDPE